MFGTANLVSPEELVRVFGNWSAMDMLRSPTPGDPELSEKMQLVLRSAVDRLKPFLASNARSLNMRRFPGIECKGEYRLLGVGLFDLRLPNGALDRSVYISPDAELFMIRECLYHNTRAIVPEFNHHFFLDENDCSLTELPFANLYNALATKYEVLRQSPETLAATAGQTKTEEQTRILDALLAEWGPRNSIEKEN